jgi:3-oxoacyl-[acyl-carrier protein] reductase
MSGPLVGRVAVVTGSGRGIGRHVVLKLAQLGAKVVINVKRGVEEAEETLRMVKSLGGEGLIVQSDVSTEEGARHLIHEAARQLGAIDILVNNAGLGIAAPIENVDEKLWDKQLNVNLRSAFFTSKYSAPYMKERKWGRIVNVTSVAGLVGMKHLVPYSAAKAGLIGLTRALASELSEHGITVNAVAAGLVKTKMGMSLIEYIGRQSGANEDPELMISRWARTHTLLGKLPTEEEVASLIAYLTTPEAGSVTGQVIIIDSGWTIAESKTYMYRPGY